MINKEEFYQLKEMYLDTYQYIQKINSLNSLTKSVTIEQIYEAIKIPEIYGYFINDDYMLSTLQTKFDIEVIPIENEFLIGKCNEYKVAKFYLQHKYKINRAMYNIVGILKYFSQLSDNDFNQLHFYYQITEAINGNEIDYHILNIKPEKCQEYIRFLLGETSYIKKKDEKYYLYKYVNKQSEIIYIGQSINLTQRIQQHKTDKLKNFDGTIYYIECNNKTNMTFLEYVLINKYHPAFNDALKDSSIQTDWVEPEWNLYIEGRMC